MNTDTVKKQSGGARAGAGKPSKNKIPGELKTVRAQVVMYPTQADYLTMVYGSAQAALDSIVIPHGRETTLEEV